eukprot:GHVT01066027.1.p1 GENE.GHVT01066027.1~~GHVT01066027.1.p1  ORF type:complete len:503 (-),score=64.18 GHVT01066027.1:808-2316(-)
MWGTSALRAALCRGASLSPLLTSRMSSGSIAAASTVGRSPFLRLARRGLATDIPKEAWQQPPTEVTTLPNGLRVASQWTPDETATIGVYIDSGSRFESKETNGAAHFLEHMIFKGTKRRSKLQLETEIENLGAHLNAYTAREQTVYYAKAFKKDIPQCVDILSDILTNSVLAPEAMEVEKSVILREMEEVEKSTDEIIFDRLHMTAFRDSPLGFTILGPVENIQGMKREYLVNYINTNYKADRLVIAAAGDLSHKDLVQLAEKHFGHLPRSERGKVQPLEGKPYFCGSDLIYRDDKMGTVAHAAVGMQAVSWKSPDAITFMLMQSILGRYSKQDEGVVPGKFSGNPTVRNVCLKMTVGCAEAFSFFNTCYKDTGLFGFYAQADEVALGHCIEELVFGITSLSYSVTEEDVNRGKLSLKTQVLGALDTTTAIAEDIGRQLLVYGRRVPIAEFLRRLDAIDAEEVKRVAWKHLNDQEVAVTALGPTHGLPSLPEIRRMTSWLRY